jgi:hemerythrin
MPAYIHWNSYYSVGEPSLDAQHQQIIEMINNLFTEVQESSESQSVKSILDRLVQYTFDHFKHEEEIMEEVGYPALQAHRELHDKMRQRTLDLRMHWNDVAAHDLLHFLKVWWLEHIQDEDKRYAPHLQAVGSRK